MAVAQRRTSKGRKGMRRSHDALEAPKTSNCPKCGKPIKSHTVCGSCGFYNGKKIIDVK